MSCWRRWPRQIKTGADWWTNEPWLWHAPEFDGERLLSVNLDERALAIYRDTQRDGQSPWTRIAKIRLPAASPPNPSSATAN